MTRGLLPLGLPIHIASLIYIAVSVWIVFRIVTRVGQRDWVMASLTVLPLPFLGYWFLFFYNQDELLYSRGALLGGVDASAAIVFLILAAATALFLPH